MHGVGGDVVAHAIVCKKAWSPVSGLMCPRTKYGMASGSRSDAQADEPYAGQSLACKATTK